MPQKSSPWRAIEPGDDLVLEREECRQPASVDEDNRAVFTHDAASSLVDQAGHGLAGVDRIQEQAFGTRRQSHCRQAGVRRGAVAFSDVLVITLDVSWSELDFEAECCQRLAGAVECAWNAIVAEALADGDRPKLFAKQFLGRYQPGVTLVTAGHVQVGWLQTQRSQLFDNLERTQQVGQGRTERERASMVHHIRPPAVSADFVSRCPQHAVQLRRIALYEAHIRSEQAVDEQIALPVPIAVRM